MAAHFYLRQKDVNQARKVFGLAIGKCPREKIFKAYVEMELQLANVDRCRKIYAKYTETFADSPTPWIKFAELEKNLDELERCRYIFELAVAQEEMNMPENIWRAYIDCEISLGEHDRARALYKRLLEKTKHLKVWLSYAKFEASLEDNQETARNVFREADKYFKENPELKEERLMLLEAWRETEQQFGDREMVEYVNQKMPKRVKKQRRIKLATTEDQPEGQGEEEGGWEEYYDYIFPDDPSGFKNLKILQKALQWKKTQAGGDK
eukprot:TRINITY_DN2958_c0_g1_i12.p2 TRINITY_DN2958_c0_g1~~TRINITY_DN2958_c0_g1_i12.p2  ORF type:complete len:266 (+),score=98.56 TRINITY_DN2958_c0_g1_i12:1196-1993(+)